MKQKLKKIISRYSERMTFITNPPGQKVMAVGVSLETEVLAQSVKTDLNQEISIAFSCLQQYGWTKNQPSIQEVKDSVLDFTFDDSFQKTLELLITHLMAFHQAKTPSK